MSLTTPSTLTSFDRELRKSALIVVFYLRGMGPLTGCCLVWPLEKRLLLLAREANQDSTQLSGGICKAKIVSVRIVFGLRRASGENVLFLLMTIAYHDSNSPP